jgi:hypothetical protein
VPLAKVEPPTVIEKVPIHELEHVPLVTVDVMVPLTPPNVPGPLRTPFVSVKPEPESVAVAARSGVARLTPSATTATATASKMYRIEPPPSDHLFRAKDALWFVM